MAWFRKNPNDLTDDYLKSADTVSRPAAVLYILVIVLLVGAVAFSLFITGRWIYKSVSSNNKNNGPTTTQIVPNDNNSGSTTSTTNNNGNTASNNTSGSSNTQNSTNTATQSSSTSTVTTPTKIPNTGPEEE